MQFSFFTGERCRNALQVQNLEVQNDNAQKPEILRVKKTNKPLGVYADRCL